jgi:hypothetical protein
MKKHNVRQFILIAAVLAAAGCSSVTTKYPLVEKRQPIDKEKFEGSWLLDKDVITIKFDTTGTARIGGVDWKDNRFQLSEGEMIVAVGQNANYLSVRTKEEDGWADRYYLFEYKFDSDKILILWEPDLAAFEAAVKSGQLRGTVKKENSSTEISLTDSPGVVLDFLNKSKDKGLFDYHKPSILMKI